MKTTPPLGYIKKEQAAVVLGTTLRTVDNYMKKKMIPYYKFGRRVFFKESEIQNAVAATKITK